MGANRDWKLFGSSYMVGILNADQQMVGMTPIEVWQAMLGKKGKEKKPNNRMEWGNRLEDKIIESFEKDKNVKLKRNPTLISPNNEIFCTTPDGVNFDENILLEVKNVASDQAWRWKDVPFHVKVQCSWHIKIYNEIYKTDRCYVRALIGGSEIVDRVVWEDVCFISDLELIAQDFVDNYVKKKKEPPIDASEAYTSYLKEKYKKLAEPEKQVIIEADPNISKVMGDYFEIDSKIKILEKSKIKLKNILMEAIGDNYGVISPEHGKIIWYPVSGKPNLTKVIDYLKDKYKIPSSEIDRLKEAFRGDSSRTFKSMKRK